MLLANSQPGGLAGGACQELAIVAGTTSNNSNSAGATVPRSPGCRVSQQNHIDLLAA